MMKASISSGLLLLLLIGALPAAGASASKAVHATIVYDDIATDIVTAREETGQLWISTADLKRATRFEVKPQGVCRDELCFPLPKAKQQSFLRKESGTARFRQTWFNITAFAELVHQPVAHDAVLSTWYFGLRSDQRQQLSGLQAPDFTLPDLHGKPHRLSDFRGKKVLLVTWASW
jgi:AhpC/TSA family